MAKKALWTISNTGVTVYWPKREHLTSPESLWKSVNTADFKIFWRERQKKKHFFTHNKYPFLNAATLLSNIMLINLQLYKIDFQLLLGLQHLSLPLTARPLAVGDGLPMKLRIKNKFCYLSRQNALKLERQSVNPLYADIF